jgi:hypothetical protein
MLHGQPRIDGDGPMGSKDKTIVVTGGARSISIDKQRIPGIAPFGLEIKSFIPGNY